MKKPLKTALEIALAKLDAEKITLADIAKGIEVKDVKITLHEKQPKGFTACPFWKGKFPAISFPVHFEPNGLAKLMSVATPEPDPDDYVLERAVVSQFVRLLEAMGANPEAFSPANQSARRSVDYAKKALRAGHCVVFRQVSTVIDEFTDGGSSSSYTVHCVALRRPGGIPFKE